MEGNGSIAVVNRTVRITADSAVGFNSQAVLQVVENCPQTTDNMWEASELEVGRKLYLVLQSLSCSLRRQS